MKTERVIKMRLDDLYWVKRKSGNKVIDMIAESIENELKWVLED